MRLRLAFALISIAAGGCGGPAQQASLPNTPAPIVPQRSALMRQSNEAYPIAPGGGTVKIPEGAGFAGTLGYGANNAVSGATLMLTNYGPNEPPKAPVAYVRPVLYLRVQTGGAARVIFQGDASTTITIVSNSLSADATYEMSAYAGRRTIAMYSATPRNGRLTFPSPLGRASNRAGLPLLLEVRAFADWSSFAFDLKRSGYNPIETTVGTGNVQSLTPAWSFDAGASVVHEPVYADGVTVSGVSRNLLYVGSQYGATMYALDADTGAVVWQDPVPSTSYTCGTKTSQFSIGETPAIDRKKNLLYFSDGHNQVHAVDLATGVERPGWPLQIADYTPDQNFMHGGLTYNPANGILYAVTGSTCDISPWYGRIVAIRTRVPAVVGAFFPMSGTSTPGQSGGGIWGPGGASIDPRTNYVFVAIGNADTHEGSQQNAAYAEQIVELSPRLNSVIANSYPTNIPTVPGLDDFDFGATPLLFKPPGCPPLLAALNKSGMFELYDRDAIGAGPIEYIQMSIPTDDGDFVGAPAYDPITRYVYVGLPTTQGIYQPGLAAFTMQSNCTLNPTPIWSAPFGPDGQQSGPQTPRSPISIANGVVYVANYSGNTEFAFDAATGTLLWTDPLPSLGNIGTVVANGKVYVSAGGGSVTAWVLQSHGWHSHR